MSAIVASAAARPAADLLVVAVGDVQVEAGVAVGGGAEDWSSSVMPRPQVLLVVEPRNSSLEPSGLKRKTPWPNERSLARRRLPRKPE